MKIIETLYQSWQNQKRNRFLAAVHKATENLNAYEERVAAGAKNLKRPPIVVPIKKIYHADLFASKSEAAQFFSAEIGHKVGADDIEVGTFMNENNIVYKYKHGSQVVYTNDEVLDHKLLCGHLLKDAYFVAQAQFHLFAECHHLNIEMILFYDDELKVKAFSCNYNSHEGKTNLISYPKPISYRAFLSDIQKAMDDML